jgi:KipI family sensor histidine kinase inhibitor
VIQPFGERALLVDVVDSRAAQALAASVAEEPVPGVEAVIPALATVLVELTPDADGDSVEVELVLRLAAPSGVRIGRERRIPIVYGGEHGPDLDEVASIAGMSAEEYVARHAASELRVLFCGFAPGFAYLGDLPDALRVPRLATPRTRTPAGSVAVAGAMTGIYPADLPGGWRVIGRTPLVLFDPHREPPSYLAANDTVRFEPIAAADWPPAPLVRADWR